MNISILCIGDELLKGFTVNTNLADIGQRLFRTGIMVYNEMCVKDDYSEIISACRFLSEMSDIIITTGGLGPTVDDITKNAIADWLGVRLVKNDDVENEILGFYRTIGRKMSSEKVLAQAFVPENARVIPNKNGTAPGLIIPYSATPCMTSVHNNSKYIIMLPGPPREAIPMLESDVVPFITGVAEDKIYSDYFVVAGIPESKVESKLVPIINETAKESVKVAFCASPGRVKIFLSSEDKKKLTEAAAKAKGAFGNNVLKYADELAEETAVLLTRQKRAVAVAESCTGGLLGGKFTSVSGSSKFFRGGIIAYSNDIKINILGVDSSIIKQHGAVSEECAEEMARKVAAKFNSDTAIAITGIAGPGGGAPDKPVGTVFIAVKSEEKVTVTHNIFRGSREIVRERSVESALNLLRLTLLC